MADILSAPPKDRAVRADGNRAASPVAVGERAERTSIRPETLLPGTSGRSARPRARPRNIPRKAAGAAGAERAIPLPASAALSVARHGRTAAGSMPAARRGRATATSYALAILVVAGIAVGVCIGLPDALRIGRVTVHGMASVRESDIAAALALAPGANLLGVDTRTLAGRIVADPRIARATVRRSLPDTLVVDIRERSPVAAIIVPGKDGDRIVLVDGEGVAYAWADEVDARLPVISGIRFQGFSPGQRLPSYLSPLLSDLERIGAENPSLLSAFSEIRVVRLAQEQAELLLYPVSRRIPVRMPATLDAKSLESALLVLDILAGRQAADQVEEVDFRTGTVVYRTKEAQSG